MRFRTRNVRARPMPLSTILNTHTPSETRPWLYLRLCPNIDSSISTVFPLPPSLMLPCRIFREQICLIFASVVAIVRSEIPVMRESSHSLFHCTFICKSCGGDYRQCEFETVNRQSRPNKRHRNAEARETDSERNNKELQKRYDSLLKDHERLAQAFRNQEKETQLLGQ